MVIGPSVALVQWRTGDGTFDGEYFTNDATTNPLFTNDATTNNYKAKD